MEPVCCRKLYGAAFQARMGSFLMLFRRHLALHGRIGDFRNRQFTAQTGLIKCHRLGAMPLKYQEGSEIHQLAPFWFGFLSCIPLSSEHIADLRSSRNDRRLTGTGPVTENRKGVLNLRAFAESPVQIESGAD